MSSTTAPTCIRCGATLYELLTLHPLYDGRDRVVLLQQMAFDEPQPPRFWNRSVPRDLETIVLKALAKDVQNRYSLAHDMADDLRHFLEDRPIKARRRTVWQRRKMGDGDAGRWWRRRLVVLILAAASGAVVTKLASRNLQLHRRERHAKYVQDIRQAFQYVRRNDLPEAGRLLSLHKPAHGEEDNPELCLALSLEIVPLPAERRLRGMNAMSTMLSTRRMVKRWSPVVRTAPFESGTRRPAKPFLSYMAMTAT